VAKNEKMSVGGNRLVEAIREIVSRGDARKVCLMNEEKHLLDIPITTSDPASPANVLEAPVLAAIRAFGSLVNECTIEVERRRSHKQITNKPLCFGDSIPC
jgi:hypothetical protein